MVVLSTYCDFAGSEDDGSYLVGAAMVSTERKWASFSRSWSQALPRAVSGIHMTDYMAAEPEPPYTRIPEPTKDGLETKWVGITKRGVRKVIVVGLPVRDYRNVDKDFQLHEELGSPYNFLAWMLLLTAAQWIDRKHPGARFVFFYEWGDTGQRPFRNFIDKHKILGVNFPRKVDPKTHRWLRPLESADMVGWVVRRAANGRDVPRKLAHKVKKQLPIFATRYTESTLRRLVAARPELFPPRGSTLDGPAGRRVSQE